MIRGNARAVSASYPLTVISAHRGWFDWRLRQLWRCRDLIALLVRRGFRLALQADDPGADVACLPATAHDAHVHRDLQQDRRSLD